MRADGAATGYALDRHVDRRMIRRERECYAHPCDARARAIRREVAEEYERSYAPARNQRGS